MYHNGVSHFLSCLAVQKAANTGNDSYIITLLNDNASAASFNLDYVLGQPRAMIINHFVINLGDYSTILQCVCGGMHVCVLLSVCVVILTTPLFHFAFAISLLVIRRKQWQSSSITAHLLFIRQRLIAQLEMLTLRFYFQPSDFCSLASRHWQNHLCIHTPCPPPHRRCNMSSYLVRFIKVYTVQQARKPLG